MAVTYETDVSNLETTQYYNLYKPGYEDVADINVLNMNADILDAILHDHESLMEDLTDRAIDGVVLNRETDIKHFAECVTDAATSAKNVNIPNFRLYTGSLVFVKFKVTNTAANPTLNVNSTGAKAIQYRGTAITAGYLAANRTYAFVYDGTNYQLIGDLDTNTTYSNMTQEEATTGTATTARSISAAVLHQTAADEANKTVTAVATGSTNGTVKVTTNGNKVDVSVKGLAALAYNASLGKADVGLGNVDNTADANKSVSKAATLTTARTIDGVDFNGSAAITHYGTCSTAAATAAKTVACTSYKLVTGSLIYVKFTVTNTAANPTLNVNSTGAKAIQYRGSAIAAGYLAANRTYAFVYDGTNYQLIGDLDTNTTYSNMTAATASAAGKAGLVPAPAAGKQTSFLRGDGTWAVPTNTTYSAFVKSGSSAAAGLVPKPSTTAGTTKYLCEDATWKVPPNTTYSNMTAATASAAGTAGLVPAPAAGKQASFLRGDGTWVVPTDTNTHYTSHLYAGSGSAANATTTNGNTKITLTDDSTVRNSVVIKGTGATTVTSDASGNITVNSTNTTYSAGTAALLTAGTDTTNRVWTAKMIADFVNGKTKPGQSLAANGYVKLDSGLIIQWGKRTNASNQLGVNEQYTFPIQFPNEVYGVFINPGYASSLDGSFPAAATTPQNENLEYTLTTSGFLTRQKLKLVWWFAIGR